MKTEKILTRSVYKKCIYKNEVYTYFLTSYENDTSDMPRATYGVAIRLVIGEDVYENETAPIFCQRTRAVAFLSFLADHLVTPSNLPYVLEDEMEI